jgi:4-hydroxy-4-methyl-2-oxoglutarate aldolase
MTGDTVTGDTVTGDTVTGDTVTGETATDELVAGLAALPTSAISDALDRLGIAGQIAGIAPLDRGFRIAGRAFTVLYQPVDDGGGTVGDYIDDVEPGSVIVLDNAGRTDATVWGDILTLTAHQRQVAGTVIDGVCRDSDQALALGYPLFSRGTWMRTGKDRVQLAGQQVPVTAGGVRVRPGDALIGDGDGVVLVPAGREAQVLDVAQQVEQAENEIRKLVRQGARLAEARAQAGYHTLQTRQQR